MSTTRNVSKDFFNRDNLERLARDPRNEVYEYVTDEVAPENILAATDVEAICRTVRAQALRIKAANPKFGRTQIRIEIMKLNPGFETGFAVNYAYIFDTCCDPETDDLAFKRMMYLIFMKQRQQAGVITEDLAAFTVNQFLLTEFRKEATGGGSGESGGGGTDILTAQF